MLKALLGLAYPLFIDKINKMILYPYPIEYFFE